ncbi:MAG: hypothetical protein MK132_25525 [Lentisphaerales bacterium]|nr:hypothetical protein [Lentisphaerales bacterium]
MTLKSSYHQLSDLHKTYRQQWSSVKETWKDNNAESFEKDFILPLNRHISSSLDAILELEEIFTSIKEDFNHE